MAKIDSIFDFSDKALVELKSWLEPWFRPRAGVASPTGDTIDGIITGLGPAAWWKLDETTGTVAHDSSGNGHDLTSSGYTPPTWAQPAGPPGTLTAQWTTGAGTRLAGSLADFTNNFTAGVWVKVHAAVGVYELVGQGTGGLHASGGGWALLDVSGTFGVGSNGTVLSADNPLSLDSWYFVAAVRDAGTWKLYINGLLQSTTISTSPGSGYGGNTWLGNDAFASHISYLQNSFLSYAFIFNSVLTGAQLLSIYNSAALPAGANAGKSLLSTGLGGTYWDFSSSAGSGTTVARPTVDAVGISYFDTTLGKPIWWNGTVWKDATGTTV